MANEEIAEANFIDDALKYTIRNIDENKKFWMIRTKKGFFFQEFIADQFVALGWNSITQETDFGKSQEEDLKEHIKNRYGDSKPLGAINKCKSFIFDINAGDYILIPSRRSERIAIAKAGEYYEDESKKVIDELTVIPKIDSEEKEILDVKCPYKKRRHIEVLKIISPALMNYNLRQAVSNYHGLSNLDKYGEGILNCLYDCYIYKNNLNIAINVKQTNPLNSRQISKLLYSFTEFVYAISNVDDISTTINLNSPGSIRMKLKNAVDVLKGAKIPLIFIFLTITGGKGLGFELPGIVGTVRDIKTLEIAIEKEKADLEKEKEEVKTQRIENMSKVLELYKTAEEEGVDIQYILQQLETLNSLKVDLQFESEDIGDIDINEMQENE